MVHLFIHLILRANHEPKKWMGIDVNTGQTISGRKTLSAETGISEQSIRTCMERLKSTNEITIESTNKYTLVTIVNWGDYQDTSEQINQENNPQANQQLTSNQPATNHKQELKNDKNEKNNKKIQDIYVAWNLLANEIGLKIIRGITKHRKRKLLARLGEKAFEDNIGAVFDAIRNTPFLRGKNKNGWQADFDWIIKDDNNYVKILEGKYSNKTGHDQIQELFDNLEG